MLYIFILFLVFLIKIKSLKLKHQKEIIDLQYKKKKIEGFFAIWGKNSNVLLDPSLYTSKKPNPEV